MPSAHTWNFLTPTEMKSIEQRRAQAQRIVNLIDTRGGWVNRLYRFTQYLIKYHPDLIIINK